MRRHIHIPSLLTAALATGALLSGCGATGSTGGDPGPGAGDDTLSVVGPFELHSLDPATSEGFFTRMGVSETLVDADPDGTLTPALATRWRVAADRRTWRFELREGATFHDGTAVTAAAVASALEVAATQEASPLSTVPLAGVTSRDDAVVVTLEKPFAPLPAVLAHTSTQVLAPASYDADGAVTEVIGSGPYRVEDIEQPARIDVVAAETWSGEQPQVERIGYQAVGRAETRALMAESGQADVTFGMDPVSLQRVRGADGVEVHSVTLPRSILLKLDAGHPFLEDPRTRRALSAALDREAIATALLRDPEMAATQLLPPSLPQWHDPDLAPLEHDQDAARDLLAEAGWREGDDGVLERDGQRLELTLRTFPDRPELPVIATAVQDALGEVGIDVDVRIGSSSEIPAGHQDGSLELALFARNYALVPDPLVTLLQDLDPDGAEWGAMGWTDAEVTRRLARLAATTDAAGAADAAGEADRRAVVARLQEQLPLVPVAWYRQSAVVAERVTGFELDPLERSWLLEDLGWSS